MGVGNIWRPGIEDEIPWQQDGNGNFYRVVPNLPGQIGVDHSVPIPTERLTENVKPSNPKDAIGIKKVSMSCVPATVLMEIALGMMEGTVKYGRHNYRAVGVRSSVYYDATMRHLMDWWEGEDLDPDSDAGLNHISKAITSLTVLRDAMIQGKLEDDRPPPTKIKGWLKTLSEKAGKVIDQHKDKSPKHYTMQDEV
jgi:hypothetical protein